MTASASEPPQQPHAPATAPRSFLNLARLLRLCRKELREILRDRRTMVTLFLMPLLAYPLLSMAFQRLIFSTNQGSGPLECLVGVTDEALVESLKRNLASGSFLVEARRQAAEGEPRPTDEGSGDQAAQEPPRFEFVIAEDVEAAVSEGTVDVGVRVQAGSPLPEQRLLFGICLVGVETQRARDRLQRFLAVGGLLSRPRGDAETTTVSPRPRRRPPRIEFVVAEDLDAALQEGTVDIGVRLESVQPRAVIQGLGPAMHVDLLVRQDAPLSRLGAEFISGRLQMVNERALRDQLKATGSATPLPADYELTAVPVAQPTAIRGLGEATRIGAVCA